VDAAAFVQDMALILTLRRPLISDTTLNAIWSEMRLFAKHATRVAPTITADGATPQRTNPIDLASVARFAIENDLISTTSMRAPSIDRFTAELEGSDSGMVLAMHRQDHIVSSCMTMAQLTAGRRQAVFLFEAADRSVASAALWRLFDGIAGHVRVLSTSPRDIVRAVRLAREGAAVAIAADIVTDRSAAVSVPWGTGVRSAMLGSAYVASASKAALYGVTPVTGDDGLGDILVERVESFDQENGLQDLSLYLRTLSLWDILEDQADLGRASGRAFPARAVIAHILDTDSLRQCLANLGLSHPPVLQACPSLVDFIKGKSA
jgi:hypothetical protein